MPQLPLRSLKRSGALGVPGSAFGAGGRGTLIPIMESVVEIPQLMVSPRSRIRRISKAATRTALKKEMIFHHKRRIPEHFLRFKQNKYNYARRSERTRAIKQRRSQADLVKSSKTKRRMTREMTIRFPRVGPSATSIVGILKWPHGFRHNASARQGITPDVMADEIARWTIREERTAAQHVMDTYVDELDRNLSRRAKLQIRGQLGRLGIKV